MEPRWAVGSTKRNTLPSSIRGVGQCANFNKIHLESTRFHDSIAFNKARRLVRDQEVGDSNLLVPRLSWRILSRLAVLM